VRRAQGGRRALRDECGERRSQLERERVIAGLVAGYQADPTRLDPEEQADLAAAADDAARQRVVVDQVASLTDDIRAWSVARAWGIA
jgi:dGTPase